MKKFVSCGVLVFLMVGGASGAAYVTNFNSFGSVTSNIAGQDGWTVNDITDQYSQVANININYSTPTVLSKALNLGNASATAPPTGTPPSGPNVTLSHAYVGTVGQTSMAFDFLIQDSFTENPDVIVDPFERRDRFGVSVSNGGTNIFSIIFSPNAQFGDPDADLDPFGAKWNVDYKVGVGPSVPLDMAIYEAGQYKLNLLFTPNGLSTDFLLTISSAANSDSDGVTNGLRNSDNVNVGYSLAASTVTGEFNVNWERTGANFGSNQIYIDNLSVVPEPSAVLLLGIGGLGLAFRRRRA